MHDDELNPKRVGDYYDEWTPRYQAAFVLKTPQARHTIEALERVGFLRQFVEPVGFANDIGVWAEFNRAHNFDLYGDDGPIEWCDWLELRFQKPFGA